MIPFTGQPVRDKGDGRPRDNRTDNTPPLGGVRPSSWSRPCPVPRLEPVRFIEAATTRRAIVSHLAAALLASLSPGERP